MYRAVTVVALVLTLTITALTQDGVPIPAALREARTVYVVNAGVHARVFDRSVRELRKWGRLSIVSDQAASDVTLTLSPQPMQQVHNWATGQNYPIVTHFMAFTKAGQQLYGDTFRGHIGKELARLGKRLDAQERP